MTAPRLATERAARRVAPVEAERGIFFDFEGYPNTVPSLVGTLIDGVYTATFLDDRYAPAAAHLGAPVATLEDYASTLVRKAPRERRLLFAFSEHELQTIAAHVPHYALDVAHWYRNALPIVRAWTRRHGQPLGAGTRTLKVFAALVGEPYPEDLRGLSVPATLRRIAQACRRCTKTDRPWATAPAAARKALDDLIAYNRFDCVVMQRLVARAADDAALAFLPKAPS